MRCTGHALILLAVAALLAAATAMPAEANAPAFSPVWCCSDLTTNIAVHTGRL